MNRIHKEALRACVPLAVCILLTFGYSEKAWAYAGLGPMIPMIGNWVVLVFMFLMTFLGAVTYPIRLAMRKFWKRKENAKSVTTK